MPFPRFATGKRLWPLEATVTDADTSLRLRSWAYCVLIFSLTSLRFISFLPLVAMPSAYLKRSIFLQRVSMSLHVIVPFSIAALIAMIASSRLAGMSSTSLPATMALTHGSPSTAFAPSMLRASVKTSPSNPMSRFSNPSTHCFESEQGIVPSFRKSTSMCAVSMPPSPASTYFLNGTKS